MRNTLFHVAIDEHFWDVFQAVIQTIPQHADTFVFSRHFELGEVKRFAHTNDLMCRQRARAKATLMTAAVNLCL